ncbi:unnamed protein product [Phytophthora lilii]|uniref:Unnamed protein product n=1 Tax=Phytophthora lilii TaxID=2077276 RepID=A0A9W6TUI7_9STRA|nr:unnamed protein product [Phytophthora lilii]
MDVFRLAPPRSDPITRPFTILLRTTQASKKTHKQQIKSPPSDPITTMFSSWDLVRPRFWYPMSSLEQSMMELEQMSDLMMRPRFPFGMQREVLGAPNFMGDEDDSDDSGDDFFVDLPVVARKYKPTALQLEVVPEVSPQQEKDDDEEEVLMDVVCDCHAKADTDSSTDMEVDDEGSEKQDQITFNTDHEKPSHEKPSKSSNNSAKTNRKAKRQNKNKKHNKQLRKHSYKVSPSSERSVSVPPNAEHSTYSSYSFSNSSVVDDKGRRVTTMRRRYEDSTGRLKAVHEREIDGKKLRTTWSRKSNEDEGTHESICSSGSPEEFEALWQQTPFGEAQKKTVKSQLQSESDVEREVASTAAALEDTSMSETSVKAVAKEETKDDKSPTEKSDEGKNVEKKSS